MLRLGCCHIGTGNTSPSGMRAAAGGGAGVVFQFVLRGERRRLHGRQKTEKDSGQEGSKQGESEGGPVEADAGQQRKAECGEMGQGAGSDECEHEAEERAGEGECHAFGERLAKKTMTRSIESGANGHFLAARSGRSSARRIQRSRARTFWGFSEDIYLMHSASTVPVQ